MSVYFKRRGDAPERFSVTNSLTHCASSNPATSIWAGKPYTATLSMESGYTTMSSVTVTMGGVDVTASVYSGGTISIAAVTGDLVITAVATAIDYRSWYINETLPRVMLKKQNINFTSNGERFVAFRLYAYSNIAGLYYYQSSNHYITACNIDAGNEWINQAYRTVVFDTVPTGTLRTWLEDNATPI